MEVASLLGLLFWLLNRDFQLLLQIGGSAVLFRGFECIHGRPVVFPEFVDEL